eukprot:1138179-Pyramimonas_sp.AAC.1
MALLIKRIALSSWDCKERRHCRNHCRYIRHPAASCSTRTSDSSGIETKISPWREAIEPSVFVEARVVWRAPQPSPSSAARKPRGMGARYLCP